MSGVFARGNRHYETVSLIFDSNRTGRLCRHTLGRSSVKGLKRVSKGSASIYTV
jgi:hypothetical protein